LFIQYHSGIIRYSKYFALISLFTARTTERGDDLLIVFLVIRVILISIVTVATHHLAQFALVDEPIHHQVVHVQFGTTDLPLGVDALLVEVQLELRGLFVVRSDDVIAS
jgi:hypothetical protein